MFMLGYAYQSGRVPLSAAAIEKAIELNGEAVKMNLAAFAWGRRAAAEPETIAQLMSELKAPTPSRNLSETLDEVDRPPRRVPRRLPERAPTPSATGAWSSACAQRRRKPCPAATALTDAVARSLFKLMAYKDEYEVARLYTDGHFEKQIASTFEGENLRSSSTSRRRCSPGRTRPRACRAR